MSPPAEQTETLRTHRNVIKIINQAVRRGYLERHHDPGDSKRYRAGMLFAGASLLCW